MLRFEPMFARKNFNYYFANLQCLLSSCDFCISNTVRLQLWMKEFLAFELLDDSLKKALPPVPVLLLVTLRWQVTPIQALCTVWSRVMSLFANFSTIQNAAVPSVVPQRNCSHYYTLKVPHPVNEITKFTATMCAYLLPVKKKYGNYPRILLLIIVRLVTKEGLSEACPTCLQPNPLKPIML